MSIARLVAASMTIIYYGCLLVLPDVIGALEMDSQFLSRPGAVDGECLALVPNLIVHYEGAFIFLTIPRVFFIMSTHVLDKQIDKMLRDKGVPDGMAHPVCQ